MEPVVFFMELLGLLMESPVFLMESLGLLIESPVFLMESLGLLIESLGLPIVSAAKTAWWGNPVVNVKQTRRIRALIFIGLS
jgi:hypothetical protein